MSTLVLGIGHPDRGDDAAGLLVAEQLSGTPGLCVRTVTGDPTGMLLDPDWGRAEHVLLVDSVRTGAATGTVSRWEGPELLAALPHRSAVTHELGVATTLQLAQGLGRLPPRLTLIGIEGACFERGEPVSAAVRTAVEMVASEIAGDIGDQRP